MLKAFTWYMVILVIVRPYFTKYLVPDLSISGFGIDPCPWALNIVNCQLCSQPGSASWANPLTEKCIKLKIEA